MKKMLILCLILAGTVCAHSMVVQETQAINEFATYALYASPTFPVRAYVVTLPLEHAGVALVPALGQRETVLALSQRVGALIAVNGSNYRRGGNYNGNRVNLFYLDHQVYADCQFIRGALCWDSTTKTMVIDTVFLDIQFKIDGVALPVSAVNQPRLKSQSVLYTDVAETALLSYTPGKNVIIDDTHTVVSVGTDIPTAIPNGWLVCQVDADMLPTIASGMAAECIFTVRSATSDRVYNDFTFVLAGAGLLIKDGGVVAQNLYEEFSQGEPIVHCGDEVAADFHTQDMQKWLIELRHPRTAVGITAKNELCIVIVDGRQSHSEGLSLQELAVFMQQLGCVDALNIGGGGCTTLCIESKLINSPSMGMMRPVSEALCVRMAG